MSSSTSIAFPPVVVKDETIQHQAFVWANTGPTVYYETHPPYSQPGSYLPCGIPVARRLKKNVELTSRGDECLCKMETFFTRDGHRMEIGYKPNKANKERVWTQLTLAEVVATGVFIRQQRTTPFRYKHIKHFTWNEKKCYFIKSVISSSYTDQIFRQNITQHLYKTEVPGSFPIGDSRTGYSPGFGIVIHDTPDDEGVRLFASASAHAQGADVVRLRAWKETIPLTMVIHEHTNVYMNDKLFMDEEHHRTPLLPLMTMKTMRVRDIEDEVYDKTAYPQQQRILRANLMRDVIEKALHPDLVARRVEQYGMDWIDLINP